MANISKIKLPSGNEYEIKDAVARQMISGGVSFNIVWTAADYTSTTAPSAAKLATIPSGVSVQYNNGASSATGTLAAGAETIGKFYLVYSKTQAGTLDAFDEYVTVGETSDQRWEKIGDTLIDLSDVVTNVTLNKATDKVIGSDATFTVTQPTVSLATGATAGTGVISVATDASGTTKYVGASASGANVAWNSKDQVTAVTGVEASTTNVKATATGTNVAWNSKDSVTAVTGVSATTSKMSTTTVTGVQSTTTTASKAAAATSQTTATGSGTASTTNTDWLKGCSVANEVLTIGAATMDTQTTTQFTFSDVTVPIKNSSATTVATGALASNGDGAAVATGVSASSTDTVIGSDATFTVTQPTVSLATGATAGTGVIAVATGVSASSTDTVIGSNSTFTVTQPTISLAANDSTATGRVGVLTDVSATKTNIKATASGANTAWNSKDEVTVVKDSGTSITVTKGE